MPLDGSDPRLIPLRSGLAPDGFGLAKVLGSDGRTLWFNVAGIGGVDLDAALLRSSDASAPMRLDDPPGALMLYTSMPGPKGTAVVARVDDTGTTVLWSVDTGIGRFALQQILPGETVTAFVGSRPAVPGKVSEPLLVIVDHKSGKLAAYSLWQ